MAALPETHADGDTLFCHGSPVSDVRSFLPDAAPDEAELWRASTAAQVVFGHTHLPFERTARGIELLNPGSVGMPFDHDHRAAYALLRRRPVERRRVEYDHQQAATRSARRWGTTANCPPSAIEQARLDPA